MQITKSFNVKYFAYLVYTYHEDYVVIFKPRNLQYLILKKSETSNVYSLLKRILFLAKVQKSNKNKITREEITEKEK